MQLRNCVKCEKQYTPVSANQRFCSHDCREGKKNQIERWLMKKPPRKQWNSAFCKRFV